MGRVVYAEDSLLNYLKTLTSTTSSAIGLIIGQPAKDKDYVVHMARTEKGNDVGLVEALTFTSVKEIKESLISAHIHGVNGRLPGGLSVLGTFICSPTEIFNDASLQPTLKKLLPSSRKTQVKDSFPLSSAGSGALLFHYNPVDQKYICKSLDVGNLTSTFTQVDWKFQNNCSKWCLLSCKLGLNFPPVVGKKPVELKKELEKFLSTVNQMLDNAFVVVGGKVLNESQSLESVASAMGNKNMINGSEIQVLEASIFTPIPQKSITIDDVRVTEVESKITFKGIIRSQAFINQKGTMKDAITAVKQDISRSLATRIWLHLESLVEEPEEKEALLDETIHEPPRRVSVSIPNSPLCFTDYTFSGEDCNEVIRLFKLLLDIEVTEKDINQEFETHADPSILCDSIPKKLGSIHSDDFLGSTLPTGYLIAAISFAIILIAIAVALQVQKKGSGDGKNH